MGNTRTPPKDYCNVLARAKGLDPAGYAGHFDDAVLIELPLPWRKDLMSAPGSLPPEALTLAAMWLQRYQETGVYGHRPLVIAPDPATSRPGYHRVMFYTRPDGPFATFTKVEYCVPEANMGALLWALFEAPDDLPRFARYRTPEADAVRDLLVCTHGTVDAACAKFGYPLYDDLRHNHSREDLRVWRVSHFGGHVFAPTMMDMPTGHYWAYVEADQARQIAARDGDVATLRGHYRGWAGLGNSFLQAAESALWQQHGWSWLDLPKDGAILDQDASTDDPAWTDVQLHCTLPRGAQHTYQAHVVVRHHVETLPTTGHDKPYNYPQYAVEHLERVS